MKEFFSRIAAESKSDAVDKNQPADRKKEQLIQGVWLCWHGKVY